MGKKWNKSKAGREWRKDYQRKWSAARRAAWLAGKSCVQCGATTNLVISGRIKEGRALGFSSNTFNYSKEKLDKILAETIILCRTCEGIRRRRDNSLSAKLSKKSRESYLLSKRLSARRKREKAKLRKEVVKLKKEGKLEELVRKIAKERGL